MPSIDSTDQSCFALLDDCTASAERPTSRLYTGHIGTLICRDSSELGRLLDDLQAELANGVQAVGLFTYELGEQLHDIGQDSCDSPPLAQVLLFRECRQISAMQVEEWLKTHDSDRKSLLFADEIQAGIANIQANVSESDFHHAIRRIHAYIEAGDTYQVNYTYRLNFDAYGPIHALYGRLRKRQPAPYGALIALPSGQSVLSFSPELFVRHDHGELTACPMKGTAPAAGNEEQDNLCAVSLSADAKSRAENVMIVDLLRNDLGRVAQLGSVRVPNLFEVNRHGSVLQMTSTIKADIKPECSLAEVIAAIYPCGSITGAPKHRTMEIIHELEPAPRGLYTGAIGWFDAPKAGETLGDFCLSVPIRTLVLQHEENGIRHGEMGVGAGIVHDSKANEEYAECQLKAQFVTGLANQFQVFETIHATRAQGCRHLDLHLARLFSSAYYFGFRYDENHIRSLVQQTCAALPAEGEYRLKLSLDHTGHCEIKTGPLQPWTLPVKILLAKAPVSSHDLFLRHKTSVRRRYDAAWQAAEAQGAFDVLFCNQHGELAEGARSNVFLKLDGRWCTPPLDAGLLPGVMRTVLLRDPAWQATERRLSPEDLSKAEEIVVCNALRGVLPAMVDWVKQDF
jgi:para-aminobenzoate synthetase/4-amino-4-deoxychorismate lyase